LAPIAAGWEDATGSEVRFGRHLVAAWDRVAQWGDVRAVHDGSPDPNVTEDEPDAFPTRPASGRGLWIAASFALLAPLGLLLPAKGPPALAGAISEACVERALQLDETHLPHAIAGAQFSALRYVRRDRLDQFGEHSATYDYLLV